MSEKNKLTQRVLHGGSVIVLFSLLTAPLGYFVRMILSRSLSIDDYGLIYAVISFFGIFTIINDLGFGYATAYFIPKYFKQKKYNLCWLLYKYDQYIEVGTSIVLSLIFIYFREPLAVYFFKQEGAEDLIYLFALYLIANGAVSSIQNFLVGLQESIYYSGIEFIRLLFTFIFSLLFFLYDSTNIKYYSLSFVVAYFIVIVFYLSLIHSKFSYLKTKLIWNSVFFKKSLQYAFPTFLTSSLYLFINHIDIIFLTYFQNVEAVAIYNIAFPIVSVSIILLQPIQKMILPLVSELSEGKKEKITIMMNQLLKLVPLISFYFGIFVFMFSKGIITMMFGYRWVAEATIPLKTMSVIYSVSLLNIYLTSVVAGLGAVKDRFKAALILLVASLFLGIIGAKYFGVLGIIYANALVFVLSIYLMYKIIVKEIQIIIPYMFYLQLILFFSIIFFIRNRFHYSPISIPEIFLLGFFYSLIVFFFALKTKALDKNLLKLIPILKNFI